MLQREGLVRKRKKKGVRKQKQKEKQQQQQRNKQKLLRQTVKTQKQRLFRASSRGNTTFSSLAFLNVHSYHSPPLPHPPPSEYFMQGASRSASAAPLARPLPLRHEIALKTMLEFLITRIVKLKQRCELINNVVWGF